ncbi:hypothetical protein CCR80_03500 [Rhodothalassium salexigens]|uniref:AMP-binding protein n=1 Tax=Rhodothalassium salexigens TaxID=1086 RepID=UPI0019134BBD|nr:hypothetical protein [Rhodothalassium salexigens]
MSDPLDAPAVPARVAWWRRRDLLVRVVADCVADAAARTVLPAFWSDDTPLTDAAGSGDGPGLDSLGLVNAASDLTRRLHLDESGQEERLLRQRTLGHWVDVASAALDHYDRTVTFYTSGSTGAPRPVDHRLADLLGEVAAFQPYLGAPARLVTAVPGHHIYGFLWTVLLPACADVPVWDARRVPAAGLPRRLEPGDLVVATPFIWQQLAEAGQPLPKGVVGLTSTAPCPPALAERLDGLGLERLIQLYGATETAGLAWRDAPDAAFRLMARWVRSGDGVTPADRSDCTPVALPDRVRWHDDARFTIEGRRDTVVQVAGVNVALDHVRGLLEEHEGVAQAAVRPLGPGREGLKAFVVAAAGWQGDADRLVAALHDHLARHLPAPARPRTIRIGPALPRTAMGKAADWDAPAS